MHVVVFGEGQICEFVSQILVSGGHNVFWVCPPHEEGDFSLVRDSLTIASFAYFQPPIEGVDAVFYGVSDWNTPLLGLVQCSQYVGRLGQEFKVAVQVLLPSLNPGARLLAVRPTTGISVTATEFQTAVHLQNKLAEESAELIAKNGKHASLYFASPTNMREICQILVGEENTEILSPFKKV